MPESPQMTLRPAPPCFATSASAWRNTLKTAEERARPRRNGKAIRLALLAILVIAGFAALGAWLAHRWTHVEVDDARIAADVIAVGSQAAGRVTKIAVIAGDRVAKGDLLASLESEQAELQLKEIDADIARTAAEQSRLRAQQAMVRNQIDSRRTAARAQLEASEAEHSAAEADLATVKNDYERMGSLRRVGMISLQGFEAARGRFLTAQQQERRSAAGVRAARAAISVIEAEAAETNVIERQIAGLEAQKNAFTARRGQQLVDLGHREIRAAFDGVVDATFVDAGEYVAPGSRLLMYHDPRKVWVDANVKETDFAKLKLHAPAKVSVDAYAGRTFKGEVARLGEATTSQFALLPSPNPSGNFTKVTQRLPVRIAIEQDAELLRPGMMVEVEIDVVD